MVIWEEWRPAELHNDGGNGRQTPPDPEADQGSDGWTISRRPSKSEDQHWRRSSNQHCSKTEERGETSSLTGHRPTSSVVEGTVSPKSDWTIIVGNDVTSTTTIIRIIIIINQSINQSINRSIDQSINWPEIINGLSSKNRYVIIIIVIIIIERFNVDQDNKVISRTTSV